MKKEDTTKTELTWDQKQELSPIFQAVCPETKDYSFIVDFQDLGEMALPMTIIRNEFMRRMKDMSATGGGYSFYGEMPENLSLVVNISHPLVKEILDSKTDKLGEQLQTLSSDIALKNAEVSSLEKAQEKLKSEEIPMADKEKLTDAREEVSKLEEAKREKLTAFGKDNKLAKQLVDLALLANGMLKGADLDKFVKRSVELIKVKPGKKK